MGRTKQSAKVDAVPYIETGTVVDWELYLSQTIGRLTIEARQQRAGVNHGTTKEQDTAMGQAPSSTTGGIHSGESGNVL